MRRESLKVLWILLHLVVLSWQDLKNREIDLGPVWLLGITGLMHSLWNGAGIWPWPGCFLLGVAVITGERIGKGDGWVLLALGMWFPGRNGRAKSSGGNVSVWRSRVVVEGEGTSICPISDSSSSDGSMDGKMKRYKKKGDFDSGSSAF